MIIIGAGTIGLLALQCARELGANSVTAIDINPQKLELAKTLGATHVFNSREMSGRDSAGAGIHSVRPVSPRDRRYAADRRAGD